MPDPQLARTVFATIRQSTGNKTYRHLEKMLKTMDTQQLQDLLRLVRDVKQDENLRCRGQARRMGMPGLIR